MMGCYRRKIKKGERWFYSGQYLGQKYHSKAIYLTKQEAKKAEAKRIGELDEQARNPRNTMTLFELIEARLDYLKLNKSKFYYTENKRYFNKALDLFGKQTPVDQVARKDINALLMAEAKRLKDKSNYKVNAMLRCLKALFNYGIKIYGLNMKNPCFGLDFYPVTINLKYIPSDTDIEAVKADCTAGQKLLIDFVDQTGCRILEAVRLKANDIDGDLVTLWTRKSKSSNLTPRRIPTPDCLKDFTGQGRVFDAWRGYPRFLEEKIKKLDQPKWNWHNLRHRRASIWAKSGMATFEIMVRLGHSNLKTTMGYLQLLGFTRL